MNSDSKAQSSDSRPRNAERWVKVAFYAGLLLVVAWVYFTAFDAPQSSRAGSAKKSPRSSASSTRSNDRDNKQPAAEAEGQDEPHNSTLIVRDVRVPNEHGKIIYRGDVDLRPTVERIELGVRLRFSHDGSVFANRERRLPSKPKNYYHEFIHPTPGDNGPGAQRIVRGRDGEVYYTPDHYRSFRRVQ